MEVLTLRAHIYISIHINLLYLLSCEAPKPRQIFKTIQKGRRQDSERCFKTGPQYVPKDGFQDFLNTSNRS